jgi:hypothetical protein
MIEMILTFEKYRPKAISSPCSSACLIALSRENSPAETHSLPAQIVRRKSFDSQWHGQLAIKHAF